MRRGSIETLEILLYLRGFVQGGVLTEQGRRKFQLCKTAAARFRKKRSGWGAQLCKYVLQQSES